MPVYLNCCTPQSKIQSACYQNIPSTPHTTFINLTSCQIECPTSRTDLRPHISPKLRTADPTSDYLADSVDAFLTSNTESPLSPPRPNTFDIESHAIPLGLTFSFPVEQTARDKGFLLTWTKGFSAKNAVNKDVVKLLQDAFDRKHLHVKCVALVNDVSLLLSYSHEGINGDMLGSRQ